MIEVKHWTFSITMSFALNMRGFKARRAPYVETLNALSELLPTNTSSFYF